jgi:hypothetical protein
MFQRGCEPECIFFRRSLLLVALVGLLLNALDCNGAWLTSTQARKCCASGHCSAANLDSWLPPIQGQAELPHSSFHLPNCKTQTSGDQQERK